uniref:Uncharacterized protein n=1 Tax=Salarias fasciatus TaxID=181472 RepID=A0A672I259_SALFA
MAEKRRSPCALSVKAHAFSVEALIGAEKRRRTSGEDAMSPGYEDGTDVSDLTGSPGPRCPGLVNRRGPSVTNARGFMSCVAIINTAISSV